MVAIGRALMARPQRLLLDEPSLGLAPAIVLDMFNAIREINAKGTSVLLVEQNVILLGVRRICFFDGAFERIEAGHRDADEWVSVAKVAFGRGDQRFVAFFKRLEARTARLWAFFFIPPAPERASA